MVCYGLYGRFGNRAFCAVVSQPRKVFYTVSVATKRVNNVQPSLFHHTHLSAESLPPFCLCDGTSKYLWLITGAGGRNHNKRETRGDGGGELTSDPCSMRHTHEELRLSDVARLTLIINPRGPVVALSPPQRRREGGSVVTTGW